MVSRIVPAWTIVACVVAVIIAAGLSSSAFAQNLKGVQDPKDAADLKSLLQTFAQGQEKLGIAEKQQPKEAELVQQNEADMKSYRAYADNHQQQETRITAITDKFSAEVVPSRRKQHNEIVQNWNRQCDKNIVGLLSEAEFQRCEALRAQMEQILRAIKQSLENDWAALQRTQIAPLRAIQSEQQIGMDETSERMKQRFAAWNRQKQITEKTRADLEIVRAQIITACLEARSKEALHLCESVGWDGANKTLPPLKNIRAPVAATSN